MCEDVDDVPWDADAWMPGFRFEPVRGLGGVEGPYLGGDLGGLDADDDLDPEVRVPEVSRGEVPLLARLADSQFETSVYVKLSPTQARELGAALLECATIAEDQLDELEEVDQ